MEYKEMYNILDKLRFKIKNDSMYFINGNRPTVCPDETLHLIAKYAPNSIEELKNIKGIGDTFVEKYGSLFIVLL